ncbi:Dabb family protein [Roseivirga sp.]|uniref:Dabb family protein n=1 Tax=Roseivirga sp. TaxID=1964215 RepID=UPI003B8B662D
MKKIILLSTFTISLLLAGCQAKVSDATVSVVSAKSVERLENPFVHTAYFWFKDSATEEQIADFKKGADRLAEIETVKFFHAGAPAPTTREVIENTYDYAVVFHFKDLEAQEFYQQAPIHLQMIEDHSDIWERVMVTDISNN